MPGTERGRADKEEKGKSDFVLNARLAASFLPEQRAEPNSRKGRETHFQNSGNMRE